MLINIIRHWLDEFDDSGHLYIYDSLKGDGYLSCKCEIQYVFIKITENSARLLSPDFPTVPIADPTFFNKINQWIVENCSFQRHSDVI